MSSNPQIGWNQESHDLSHHVSQPSKPGGTKKVVLLAVMGTTGAGKTSFINAATGGSRRIETPLEISTLRIQDYSFDCGNFTVTFVDTVGFDNPARPDILLLKDFVEFLEFQMSNGISLSGIIYLHRITDNRIGGSGVKNLQLLRELCGEQFLKKITFVTTMWDSILKEEEGISRERELASHYWHDFIARGSEVEQLRECNKDSVLRIINRFLNESTQQTIVKSSIEQEAIEHRKPLKETSAGRIMFEQLYSKVKKVEERLQRLERSLRELGETGSDRDGRHYAELQHEIANMKETLLVNRKALEETEEVSDTRILGHLTGRTPLDGYPQGSPFPDIQNQDLDSLKTTRDLASVYLRLGRYEEVVKLCNQALEKSAVELGPKNPDQMLVLQDLRDVREKQTQWKRDDAYLKKTQNRLKQNRPDTLNVVQNLASIYLNQDRYGEAIQLFKQTLKGDENSPKLDPLDWLRIAHNLAGVYMNYGHYREAEQLYQEMLKETEGRFERDSQDALRISEGLADAYSKQGRYKEAEELCNDILSKLGPERPEALRTRKNLEAISTNHSQWTESHRNLEKAEAEFGPNHPNTIQATYSLASICASQGRYEKAQELYEQVLGGIRHQFKHQQSSQPQKVHLASDSTINKSPDGAVKRLCERVLKESSVWRGQGLPDALEAVVSLAGVYVNQGRFKEAGELYELVLKFGKDRLKRENESGDTGRNNEPTLVSASANDFVGDSIPQVIGDSSWEGNRYQR